MSKGMCCSASHWIDSASSSGSMAGSSIFLMMTECPDTEVPKLVFLTPVWSLSFWIASTTRDESMIEPSTIASGDRGSTPMRWRVNWPPLRSLSSTSLTVALPISRPTTPFERLKIMTGCLVGYAAPAPPPRGWHGSAPNALNGSSSLRSASAKTG